MRRPSPVLNSDSRPAFRGGKPAVLRFEPFVDEAGMAFAGRVGTDIGDLEAGIMPIEADHRDGLAVTRATLFLVPSVREREQVLAGALAAPGRR